jgi:DnaJ-class molecular chaperone
VKNGGPNAFNFPNRKKSTGPQKTKPKLIKIDVTLEEVFSGTMKEVSVARYRSCADCEGKGGVNAKTCTDCSGTGIGIKLVQLGPGMYTQAQAPC